MALKEDYDGTSARRGGFVMNHLIHHRAQLTVYLRMNNVPVPALYGPSADEASFG